LEEFNNVGYRLKSSRQDRDAKMKKRDGNNSHNENDARRPYAIEISADIIVEMAIDEKDAPFTSPPTP
jgi:hypothetical protein